MKTFFNILQTLAGITNKIYPNEPFLKSINTDTSIYFGEKGHIIYLINNIFYKKKISKKMHMFSKNASAKFLSLNHILENTFYQNELKEYVFDIFTKAQKHYHAFSRLLHIYKLNKNPYVVTNDLMLNPIEHSHKLTFVLIEKNSNFLFNINEILNIIETSISHSPDFFPQPLSPLNPYNNQEFTHATLYNIYFQMKQIGRVIPLLFHCFFLENFNKAKFVEEYEVIIREHSIKKYVFNSPHTILYNSVLIMLRDNKYTNNLIIHKNFPKDLLVNIFRPYLFYDYIANFHIEGTLKKFRFKNILYIKLKKFYEFNPRFGREIIKLIKKDNKIIKREFVIDSKHISFYNIVSSNETINGFVTHNLTIDDEDDFNEDNSDEDNSDEDDSDEDESDEDNSDEDDSDEDNDCSLS